MGERCVPFGGGGAVCLSGGDTFTRDCPLVEVEMEGTGLLCALLLSGGVFGHVLTVQHSPVLAAAAAVDAAVRVYPDYVPPSIAEQRRMEEEMQVGGCVRGEGCV